jgi:hypothetical protein
MKLSTVMTKLLKKIQILPRPETVKYPLSRKQVGMMKQMKAITTIDMITRPGA